MKVLIFDTETTGLIKGYNESLYDTDKYPYVVQLSWILFDTETHILVNVSDNILKVPDGVDISEESVKIHGITKEISREKGKDPKMILRLFANDLKQSDICVCHNTRFDKRMMRIEFIRNKMMDFIYKGHQEWYCTMYKSKDICKIPRYNKYIHAREVLEKCKNTFENNPSIGMETKKLRGELNQIIKTLKENEKISYKCPKLIELHEYLFNSKPNNLHNSMVDVYVCFRCYYKLEFNSDIIKMYPELNTHYNKVCGL